jgi:hypothetical protein
VCRLSNASTCASSATGTLSWHQPRPECRATVTQPQGPCIPQLGAPHAAPRAATEANSRHWQRWRPGRPGPGRLRTGSLRPPRRLRVGSSCIVWPAVRVPWAWQTPAALRLMQARLASGTGKAGDIPATFRVDIATERRLPCARAWYHEARHLQTMPTDAEGASGNATMRPHCRIACQCQWRRATQSSRVRSSSLLA